MADSQHTEFPAVVSRVKRASYLRHVQIHIELLQDALAGERFGCGVAQRDREEIDKRLLEIRSIAETALLASVDTRPAAEDSTPPPSAQVIPFRPRAAG
jgi:hypothetical protein